MRFAANGTLSGAMSTSASTKGLRSFSKCWTPGDVLRVYYPIVWIDEMQAWDVIVGAVWGHEVKDYKKLKLKSHARFIPSLCDVNPDGTTNGEPDLAEKFSRIAPIFVAAQKAREIASIESKIGLTNADKTEAIKDIEAKYDPSSMTSEKPVIGRRDFITTAICVCAKISNQKLDPSTASIVYQPIKQTRANDIIDILSDPRYTPIHHEGEDFAVLEVQYSFPGNVEKKQAGKDCKVLGLQENERSAIIDPESWRAIEARCKNLPKKPEDITRRTTRSVSEQELRQAISSYAIRGLDDINALSPEFNSTDVEILCKNVDVLNELNLVRALTNKELVAALDKASNDAAPTSSVIDQAEEPTPVPDVPTLNSILGGDSTPEVAPLNSLKTAAADEKTSIGDVDIEELELGI